MTIKSIHTVCTAQFYLEREEYEKKYKSDMEALHQLREETFLKEKQVCII